MVVGVDHIVALLYVVLVRIVFEELPVLDRDVSCDIIGVVLLRWKGTPDAYLFAKAADVAVHGVDKVVVDLRESTTKRIVS